MAKRMHRRWVVVPVAICSSVMWILCVPWTAFRAADPADWGSDHVGRPLPQFASGDECLFCHRDVGPSWTTNRHNLTLRRADADAPAMRALQKELKNDAERVEFLLGSSRGQRFLKPAAAYGKLELLSTAFDPATGNLRDAHKANWDASRFADACAGCHCTAVETKARSFAAVSLDCFTCHGEVPDKHTKDTSLVLLAKKRQETARVVTSICAQCHLRGGKSRSTGLPYPNQFVPGDNLFRDFEVDLSLDKMRALNPADRHVAENVLDVIVRGKEEITCVSCHEVHKQSSKKHHRVAANDCCWNCHTQGASRKDVKRYEVHSAICGY